MIEIILTARTECGEKAIRAYSEEKITVMEKMRMRSRNIIGERKIISEFPLVHVSSIRVQSKDAKVVEQRFQVLKEQMVLLYEKKMLDYGASREDYDIQVTYD